ncbi:POU domain class 2-associating factor 2 isoform X2 [Salminus brasiliensis]|uniref:POU domain class 2-associating factor 2 isoform X2 n=1 Tax=Salminus brasiliensis TaxID=930266 RepID=UPI003B837412
MEAEYSKRVYQGVRVKHTVKDLLAEKRLRQTNGPRFTGVSTPQSPFAQMTALTGKSVSCDTTSTSGYSSLIDSYYPETFSDYRSAALSSGGSTIFSSSALSTLLPPFPGDTSHFVLRDSWEQAGTEAVEGLCGDGLAPAPMAMPATSSLAGSEPSSPSQYRSSSRNSNMPQFYSLHTLDDVQYPSSFQSTAGTFTCPPYMTASSESAAKMPALSTEETENDPPALNETIPWAKEDTSSTWSQYEMRRAF